MAKDNNIVYIDNSVINASALNGRRLHLNAKGSSLLAVQIIKFLRSGSDKFNQSRKGFRSPAIQRLGKLLMGKETILFQLATGDAQANLSKVFFLIYFQST